MDYVDLEPVVRDAWCWHCRSSRSPAELPWSRYETRSFPETADDPDRKPLSVLDPPVGGAQGSPDQRLRKTERVRTPSREETVMAFRSASSRAATRTPPLAVEGDAGPVVQDHREVGSTVKPSHRRQGGRRLDRHALYRVQAPQWSRTSELMVSLRASITGVGLRNAARRGVHSRGRDRPRTAAMG